MTFAEKPLLSRNTILRRICADARLPDSLHDLAEQRYHAVAAWLMAPGSPLAAAKPHIYPQGSGADHQERLQVSPLTARGRSRSVPRYSGRR